MTSKTYTAKELPNIWTQGSQAKSSDAAEAMTKMLASQAPDTNHLDAIRSELEKVALACRIGLMSLVDAKGSTFHGFPSGACGVAADIFGRVVWEALQYEGEYVCGTRHPKLKDGTTHAWFEVGDFIIDITYDQFQSTGLLGWVFDRNDSWHARFRSQERRQGFCMPSQWPAYPLDGYQAAREEVKKVGLIC